MVSFNNEHLYFRNKIPFLILQHGFPNTGKHKSGLYFYYNNFKFDTFVGIRAILDVNPG